MNLQKFLLPIGFLLIFSLSAWSQFEQSTALQRNCATMDVLAQQMAEDPSLKFRMLELEEQLQLLIAERQRRIENGEFFEAVRTIPVVVHVVYNTAAENISDAQINSQIRILNEDFRRMAGTNGSNTHPDGADTEIEFVLASVDPNGNSTTGVTRTSTTVTSFSSNDNVKFTSSGGRDVWDASSYMNIWVCDLSGTLLGYAQFPGGNAATDGVVIDYQYFGDTGTATPPFDLGRTATHEVGHYLNLRHIWGDGPCGVDDFVADTPESDNPNYGCATGHVSCGTTDMVENYMDYSDDACMNIYTNGQSARMNSILDGTRSGLVSGGGGGTQDYATLPYSSGFESGAFDQYWAASSDNGFGRIQVTTANVPHSGSYHLTMDSNTNGNYATNEARLHLNLSGESNVDLDFWWKEYGDETHTQDGVYFSDNGGASYVKVQDLNGQSYTNSTWIEFNLDLDALAAANGLSLNSTFVVKFQQYDNYVITTDGFAFDDISVTGSGVSNVPPTAQANGPYSGTAGVPVGFSSAGSSDPDGSISSYLWDFGDGGSSTSANPGYSYASAGTYSVTLTVTDNAGAQASDNATATIVSAGGNYATLPYSAGFEGGSFDQYWSSSSDNGFGRVLVTTANTPHGGSYHLTMDSNTNGNYATNEATLNLDLGGQSNVTLAFWWKEYGDETHAQDGVYFSDDGGASFVKVQDLNGQSYTNSTWNQFSLDVDALAAAGGLSMSSTFVVKFQQYDNYVIATDGFAFDDISVTAGGGGGGTFAALPYSTGFESGSVDQYWSISSDNSFGRILVTTANTPNSGSYHLTMDSNVNGNYATNEAVLNVDLAGESGVTLDFSWKEYGDETHSQDGVYFSDDGGASYVKVQDLNGQSYTNSTWNAFSLDVDALAAAGGLALSSTFSIKFQQYDNYAITTDGFAFDDISVTVGSGGGSHITSETESNNSSGTANGAIGSGVDVAGTISSTTDDDWFYMDVTSAGNLNISVAIGSSADLDWYLYHESDLTNWVARGYTTSNPEAATYNATATGRYYIWVDGYNGATSSYTLSVTGGIARFQNPGKEKEAVPIVFALSQNYPNPFNPTTTIKMALPERSDVSLRIYDITGRLVSTMLDDSREAGYYQLEWNGRNLQGQQAASGLYIYRIDARGDSGGRFIRTLRMMLLK